MSLFPASICFAHLPASLTVTHSPSSATPVFRLFLFWYYWYYYYCQRPSFCRRLIMMPRRCLFLFVCLLLDCRSFCFGGMDVFMLYDAYYWAVMLYAIHIHTILSFVTTHMIRDRFCLVWRYFYFYNAHAGKSAEHHMSIYMFILPSRPWVIIQRLACHTMACAACYMHGVCVTRPLPKMGNTPYRQGKKECVLRHLMSHVPCGVHKG